jgi:hypothetical protein
MLVGLLGLTVLLLPVLSAQAQTPKEALLRASNANSDDLFGYSVTIDGDRAVVGTRGEDGPSNRKEGAGAAYVFEWTAASGWQEEQVLRASNAEEGDAFGASVAIDGDRVIVGASFDDGPSNGKDWAGAAYVFEWTAASGWQEVQILRASNANSDDNFGHSVAVDGDRLIVGADGEAGPSDNTGSESGAAYVFERTGTGWKQNEDKILRASNSGIRDRFGASVAIDGDRVIVGAPYDDGPSDREDRAGAAYVFEHSGATWGNPSGTGFSEQTRILRASNVAEGDAFGTSVAIDGDRLIIGAPRKDGLSNGKTDTGAAYVFERTSSGWNQNEDRILWASDAGDSYQFGYAVAIDGDQVVIGAPGAEAAYVFERSGVTWGDPLGSGFSEETKVLRASNADQGDQFGFSAAVDGDRAIVGARLEDGSSNGKTRAGAAYVKALRPPTFTSGKSTSLTVKENGSLDLTSPLAVADKSSGDNLTWRVSSALSHGSLSGVDGQSKSISGPDSPHTLSTNPTYAPDAGYVGADSFTIQVSDGSATDEITVDVTINGAPSISSLADRVIRAGQTLGPVGITVSDPETAEQQLSLSASADDAILVPQSGLTLTGPDASGNASLEVEPASGETGTATVTVTVENNEGYTASSSFALQVAPDAVLADVSRSFGDASGPGDYRLVALPGQVSRPLGQAVSGDAGQEWQAYRDDGTDSGFLVEYDGSDDFTFTKGNGFWLTSTEQWTSSLEASAVSLENGTAEIDLRDGWNVISNPLDTDVSWSAVEKQNVDTQDGESLQPLWGFDGSFGKASTFASATKGEAYYFLNDRGLDALQIPYPSPSTPKAKPIAESNANTKETSSEETAGRVLRLTARQAEAPDSAGTPGSTVKVGLHPDAERSVGPTDVAAPPARFSALALRVTPEANEKSKTARSKRTRTLMTERRPESEMGEGYTYSLRLRRQGEGPVTIGVDGAEAFSGRSVALVNPASGTSYDLRKTETVEVPASAFGPEGETALTVAVGTEGYVAQQKRAARPSEVTLTAYPNPVQEQGTLEYMLPEAGEVSLQVYDVLGRQVATLASGQEEAGAHTAELEASRLSSGVYIARLKAGGTTVTRKITVVR